MKQKAIKFVSLEEFNEHLLFCKKYRVIKCEERKPFENNLIANLIVKRINVYLTYRKGLQTTTYCFKLDEGENNQLVTGVRAYATIQRYYKIPDMSNNELLKKEVEIVGTRSIVSWIVESATPLLYSNPNYTKQELSNCYEYDLISAYGWALTQPIPDTTAQPRFNALVKEGEIGFLLDGTITFNSLANIIFPLIDSPFKKFVKKWFELKKSDNKEESNKAKQMINYAVGYMQRKNPFIRNTIVNRCSMLIEQYIDENTLYCNTDSLISKVERNDLPIGEELGRFKIKHFGSFKYDGYNYQWNDEKPTYRGISKQWFEEFEKRNKRPWDILRDEIPDEAYNKYYFDEKKFQIIRRTYNENQKKKIQKDSRRPKVKSEKG